ncbi:FixH family protein [Methylocapsa palsarum]|uniref:Nitrogen fixation protein FixH n=1 Tax=Methylocapsa palsarum TaxID=1612308 RepID=A0A1I3ZBJ4_9HYPH|nr:FixH family protein [Methylocapsa palsarum]SFK40966.1 Nitrogen fixation protein FixH [Methylocapsa palsarum]
MSSVSIKSSSPHPLQERPLTGRKVLAMLIGFFGVVIGANMALIHYATSTFAGLESDSAYSAGIAYGREIKASHAQDKLHWKVDAAIRRDSSGTLEVTIKQADESASPTDGLSALVQFEHPANRSRDRSVALAQAAPGIFTGALDLDPGRWDLVIDLRRNGETMFRSKNRVEAP